MAGLSDHADDIERMYFDEGMSYQWIADQYGVTREGIRQFLNRKFSGTGRPMGREFRSDLRRAEKAEAESRHLVERKADVQPCVVCYDPVLRKTGGRGANRTCTPKHAKLWSQARFILDPKQKQKQRLSMANSILKYPDNHVKSARMWAQRVIDGEATTRTYIRKDSGARRAYEEVVRIRIEKGYRE